MLMKTDKICEKGQHYPLGACIKDDGVNFALYSMHAEEVFLLLFEIADGDPSDIIKVENKTEGVWHIFVRSIKAGQLYGYKIKGPFNPDKGLFFNENKLLIDPYTKAVTKKIVCNNDLLYPYKKGSSHKNLEKDERDNSHIIPKSIVITDDFNWQGDSRLNIPLEELIIYEVHLKGFTRHNSSKVTEYTGTYTGFIQKIPHLKSLSINAVELLPVSQHSSGDHLNKMNPQSGVNLTEYWGYNTICFFAPDIKYSTQKEIGCQVTEFKTLVRELHKAGIEVILDVVYNHTGEGNQLGPVLSLKGIDNLSYYSSFLDSTPSNKKSLYRYLDDTGCGNTIDIEKPPALRLIMDSLRYWVEVMHVDGFRFDLATILGRQGGKYNKASAFFKAIYQDPVLTGVKLIAEPWDLTTCQVGNFPEKWSEWNGKYRDTVRRFWKGEVGQIKDLAWRLTGSADLYEREDKRPSNSINYITSHDGFTLYDLYSYNKKYNEANGENNADGSNENYSFNCGAEGETDNLKVLQLRKKMVKNAICTLFFSLGTPMILGGDEMMHTQKGNNNPYCQDNEITWFDWKKMDKNSDIFIFCKKAISFRRRYNILYKKRFYSGRDEDKDMIPDILWFDNNLKTPEWNNLAVKLLCYQIDGSEVASRLGDYHLFFIMNADIKDYNVKLPIYSGKKWFRVIDTNIEGDNSFLDPGEEQYLQDQTAYRAGERSLALLLGKSFAG